MQPLIRDLVASAVLMLAAACSSGLPPCSVDSDCAADHICTRGVCTSGNRLGCTDSTGCGDLEACIDGICQEYSSECIGDSDCVTGWFCDGRTCRKRFDTCSLAQTAACDVHAECDLTVGGPQCRCIAGYDGDGTICTDVDECLSGAATCSTDATCTNTDGAFFCTCNPGFQGNGFSCASPTLCTPGLGECDANATCTGSVGSEVCECNSGWEGDGGTCFDFDECARGTDNCVSPEICVNEPGGFSCSTDGWGSVAAGENFSCGLLLSGRLYCWGQNNAGQLGINDPSPTYYPTPQRVGGRSDWVEVSAGDEHACARAADNTVWCWGKGSDGRLGNGQDTNRDAPVQVGSSTDWVTVDAGARHTCGVRSPGTLWCWGSTTDGVLGIGTTLEEEEEEPVRVGGASDWEAVSAGGTVTCGLRDSQLFCWGANDHGQLGQGTTSASEPSPVVVMDDNWSEVAAGDEFACAIREGSVYCWGRNVEGQVGIGSSTPDILGRSRVDPEGGWDDVWTGRRHACGLRGDNMRCWGDNALGQVGVTGNTQYDEPTTVSGMWDSASPGRQHSTAVSSDGELYRWGNQLDGLGGQDDAPVPLSLP